MHLHVCLFVCVLNILGSRAAPYLDAYINPDRSGFDPGVDLSPEFQMGNWSMDYNMTSDYDGDVSPPPGFIDKVPGQSVTVTVDKELELFLFMPADEDACYIKDMEDFEDDMAQGAMVRKPDDCDDANKTPIPEQINLSLPEKCRSLPVKWLDEFYCNNDINPDNPDVIKALRGFPGHKRFCTYDSTTVRTQTCYCWSCGKTMIKKKTLVCLRSIQINSRLKCKKEVTNYQSGKEYFVTEDNYNDQRTISAD